MGLSGERMLQLKTETGDELIIKDSDLAGISLDPYLLWACETQFRYYKNLASPTDTDARLLIELSDAGATDGTGVAALADLDCTDVADIYTNPALHLRGTHFLTAQVQLRAFVLHLRNKPEIRALIKGLTLSMVISPETGESHPKGQTALWADGFDPQHYQALCDASGTEASQVIVGVVDDGIAFLNDQFCRRSAAGAEETRFIGYWDQNSPPRPGGYGQNASAAYGQVFDREAINDMLRSPYAAAHVYRKERLYRLDRRQSHGTAVLDIAAGSASVTGADAASLLAVQLLLPRSGDDNSGGWLDGALLDALRFMLDQVDSQWAKQRQSNAALALPQLVVNVSYSNQRGAHDGSSTITRAIDELISSRIVNGKHTLAVVFSAGNELQSRLHAEIPELAPGETEEIRWQLPPDDDTPSFVELRAKGQQPAFSVELMSPEEPNKPSVQIKGQGKQAHAHDANGDTLASAIASSIDNTSDCTVLLALAPTDRREFGGAKAHFGIWNIHVCNTSDQPISLDAWIQSDRSRLGESNRGRQSSFRDSHYRARIKNQDAIKRGIPPGSFETSDQSESKIKRSNTLNALATGKHTLSAAGYIRSTGDYADYAALGKDGWNTGPDVATVCQTSPSQGVATCGTASGGHTQITGTSAAAPALTRRLAKQWQSQPGLSPHTALQQMIAEDKATISTRYPQSLNPNGREIDRLLLADEPTF